MASDDWLWDMVHDNIKDNFVKWLNILDGLLCDIEKPLYSNYTKFTWSFNLKVGNEWSGKSFTYLLQLLKNMLPEGNELPNHSYKIKKIFFSTSMDYKKIHAFPNNCILYWKEYISLNKCLRYRASVKVLHIEKEWCAKIARASIKML